MLDSMEFNNAVHSNNLLPRYFTPGSQHVVIGKGKKYCQHSGNLYLRDIVQSKMYMYLNATSKVSKSCIISSVIDQIHGEGGFFVQLENDTGRWIKATEYLTREKTSQAFRDALRHQYKSSRQNKRRIQMEDNPTFIFNPPLIDDSTSAPQQSCKRRRTENTTVVSPNTSLPPCLEFPMLPQLHLGPSCSHQLSKNTIPSTQSKEDGKEEIVNTDFLFTNICSTFLSATADDTTSLVVEHDTMNLLYHDVVIENDPLKPIPIDEISIAPL